MYLQQHLKCQVASFADADDLLAAGRPVLLPSWLVTPPKQPAAKAMGSGSNAAGGTPLKAAAAAAAAAAASAAAATGRRAPIITHLPPRHERSGAQQPAAAAPGGQVQLPLPPPQLHQGAAAGPTPLGGALPWPSQQPGIAGSPQQHRAGNSLAPALSLQTPQTPQRADAAAAAPPAKKRRVNRYTNIREQDRCGHCKTCLNRAMKKACLTRRAELDAAASAAAAAAAAAGESWGQMYAEAAPTGAAVSAPAAAWSVPEPMAWSAAAPG